MGQLQVLQNTYLIENNKTINSLCVMCVCVCVCVCRQTDGIIICTSDSSQNAKCEVLTVVTTQITAVCDVTLQYKGKAVMLQAWSGPEGSRKLRFPDFMTRAEDGGKVRLTHRPPLAPGNTPGMHFC